MDFIVELVEPIIHHLRTYTVFYMIGTPAVLLGIALTYRYSLPLILYAFEYAVYAAAMHTIIHVLVRLFAWFKNSSSMDVLDVHGRPLDMVFWRTPWLNFWELEVYDPYWVIYVEGVFLVIILGLMIRYRPLKTQRRRSRYTPPPPPPPEDDADDDWGVPKKRYYTPVGPINTVKTKKK